MNLVDEGPGILGAIVADIGFGRYRYGDQPLRVVRDRQLANASLSMLELPEDFLDWVRHGPPRSSFTLSLPIGDQRWIHLS